MKLQFADQLQRLESGSSGEILELLQRCAQAVPPELPTLHNFYQEVPVAAEAVIVAVADETLVCRTTPAQSRAIAAEKHTIIRSAALPHAVHAVARYDAEADQVVLCDFSYVEVLPDRRGTVRVRVPGLCQVEIEAGPGRLTGRMKSISLSGCAVDVAERDKLGTFRYFFVSGILELKGGGSMRIERVQCRLIRIEEGQFGMSRCIMVFEHDLRSEDSVGRYVAQRQAEVIRELRL